MAKHVKKNESVSFPEVVQTMLSLAGGKKYTGEFLAHRFEEELKIATTRDEVFLQVITLIGIGRTHGLYNLVLTYAKKDFLTKDDIKALIMLVFKSNPHDDAHFDLFLRAEDSEGNSFFSVKEAWKTIMSLTWNIVVSSEKKYRLYESFHGVNRSKKIVEDFPLEILKEWVVKGFGIKGWACDYGKYTAIFAIELYRRGDTEIITPENLATYMERIASVRPDSHGIHRVFSLLGYGSEESERGWNLHPYKDLFADTLFKVFLGEIRSYVDMGKTMDSLPISTEITLKVLDDFEDKNFVEIVKDLFEARVTNARRNIEASIVLLRKAFKNGRKK